MRGKNLGRLLLAMLCAASWAAVAHADEGAEVAKRFAALPAISDISLSPDGKSIAFLSPLTGGGAALNVVAIGGNGEAKVVLGSNREQKLRSCGWVANSRLICSLRMVLKDDGKLVAFIRQIAVNADGSKLVQVTAHVSNQDQDYGLMQDGGRVVDWYVPGKPGSVLMTRQFVPQETTGSLTRNSAEGLGVEQVDTETLTRHTVEQPRAGASSYISDGQGNIRIVGIDMRSNSEELLNGATRYLYRTAPGQPWRELSSTNGSEGAETGFTPYAVDPVKNVAYGFERKDGRLALFSLSLDGALRKELILARPDVDVDGLIEVGRHHRVVGVSYATDHRSKELFDPELRALDNGLAKALPGDLALAVTDASEDESKLLIFASSDIDSGKYYFLDRATHRLAEVGPKFPALSGMNLGQMKAITYPAADGAKIPAYLTLPPDRDGHNLPAIVMPHGGPTARDEWGFDYLIQFFVARGFAVIQPEYRGSAGYGDEWLNKNAFHSWRRAIGDINDAGRWLTAQGIAAPGKLAIFGWSYGGYAALQSAVVDPDLFKAVVAVAPVTDFDRLRAQFQGFTSYRLADAQIGHGPDVEEGSPARHANVFKAPVLLFHGDRDENVDVDESRLMKSRLDAAGKTVTYIEFPGLDHYLEDAPVRARLLETSDQFIRKTLGIH
jgi:dipeptidyl aminopeptidase/acylaminoacyl peptidase